MTYEHNAKLILINVMLFDGCYDYKIIGVGHTICQGIILDSQVKEE
jgi:hypothetical protein